jgi:hypothetical protein
MGVHMQVPLVEPSWSSGQLRRPDRALCSSGRLACRLGSFGERRDGDPTSPTEGDPLYELFVPRDSGNCP